MHLLPGRSTASRVVASLLSMLLAGGTLGTPVALSRGAAAAPAGQDPTAGPPSTEPVLLLTARQQGADWQYSLTIAAPADRTLGELRVELAVPPGGELIDALEARPETEIVGASGGQVIWKAIAPANSFVGPFSATVRGSPSPATEARISWAGPPAGEQRTRVSNTVALGGRSAALRLTPEGNPNLVALDDTGLLASIPPGVVGAPTSWTVTTAGREANPPESMAPDVWWCAAVDIAGSGPLDAPIVLLLPTRQPLTPGAEVRVFQRGDADAWQEAALRGVATPDGLFVAVPVAGPGLYVAGTPSRFQQVALGGQASFQSLPVGGQTGAQTTTGGTGSGGQTLGQQVVGQPAVGQQVVGQQPLAQQIVGDPGVGGQTGPGAQTSTSGQPLGGQGVASAFSGGALPARVATSNCGGFGICAFGGASQFSASCTPDASVCVSSGGGPPPFSTVCSGHGATGSHIRVCTSQTGVGA